MKAYHFHNGRTLRDGRPLPPLGQKLVHDGPLVLCESGLHFSRHPFDALQYAPGPFLDIVHVGGIVIEPQNEDKGVCSERTRIKTIDATPLLRKAARWFALEVVHLWNAPAVVKNYLATGDESLRAAAWAAAWAAREAARAAAEAAWEAAWAAAGAAAAGAAWEAAASDAAWAAWAAASDAAWAAASDAAGAAVWEAAAWAVREAVRDAARGAVRQKQRQQFLSLVKEAFVASDPRAGQMDY